MMRKLLRWIVARLPAPRIILDREGGSSYLSRWYLLGVRRGDDHPVLKGQSAEVEPSRRLPFNLFLHQFHRSDDDGALHSHPWAWALSLMLVGGYREERRVGDAVVSRTVRAWSLNVLRSDDYHRVDLLEADAWSLFLVGPKVATWHFWDRTTLHRSPWHRFIEAKRLGVDAGWELDTREPSQKGTSSSRHSVS